MYEGGTAGAAGPLHPPEPPLCDGSLRLRALEDRDVAVFTAALEDPAIHDLAYSGHLPAEQPAVRAYVERYRIHARDGHGILLAVADEADAMTGLGMLYGLGRPRLGGEIGFWVAPAARGAGAGAATVRLLVRWALGTVGLERVRATTAVSNGSAQAVLERVGFQREGILRGADRLASGGRRDMVAYALLADDPPARAIVG